MGILNFSPERAVYQAISQFQVSWAASTFALADAALIYGQTGSFRLAENLHFIRIFSNIVNGGWALWDAVQLVQAFKERTITISPQTTTAKISLIAIAAVAAMGVGFFPRSCPVPQAWEIEPEILEEKTDPKGVKSQVTLSLQHPNSQKLAYVIYLSRIVMNLLTAYFSPERRLLCGLNTPALAVGFFKTHQLKWLNFSRKFDFAVPVPPTNIKRKLFSYTAPLLPFIGDAKESCPICLNDTPDTSFTPQEPVHYPCLVNTILNKSDHFLDNNQNIFVSTKHYQDNRYTGTSYTYKVKIPQENLPAASTSRVYPSNHFLQLIVENSQLGKLPTTIDWIPNPHAPKTLSLLSSTLWARLGCIYSTFQTILAAMQSRHPELAEKILSAQKILTLFDVGALIQNFHQLYHILYEKYIPFKINQNASLLSLQQANTQLENARLEYSRLEQAIEEAINNGTIIKHKGQIRFTVPKAEALVKQFQQATEAFEQALNTQEDALQNDTNLRTSLENKYRFYLLIAMGLGSVALGAASASAVSCLNRQLRPAFNLTEILKKIATPADFSNMQVSWSLPWLPYASQCLIVSRIIMNLALAYFSSDLRAHLLSAFFQSLTVLKLAQLPWVKLERAFIYPQGPMWGKKFSNQHNINTLHTSFEFLLPPFPLRPTCSSAASHFESSLKAAYEFTTQFFKESTWSRYMLITKKNGVETSRKLHYNATVQPSLLTACSCTVSGVFTSLKVWATDAIYGYAPVHIE